MKNLIFIIVLLPILCFAQKQGNIWYFGDHAGLDFNTSPPTILTDGQTAYIGCSGCHAEGTAVICDSSGTLLFYTDGNRIWNRNHQIMPDGDGLYSNISSTQSSLIVPQPGSSRYFYVFTTDDFFVDHLQYGLRYSLVDMCLDNGNGDIVKDQKNILLLDMVAEKLTAVRHTNGEDYWIITHKYYSDAFYTYHLSSLGIVDTVISHVGSAHPTGNQTESGAIGQLKASPNGQKLAIVNGNSSNNIAEYFDFDNSTGVVSNCIDIQWNINYNFYGISFSPDNSKLYIACTLNGNGIYQFDLNAGGGNPDSVRVSRTLITGSYNYNYFGLQLATNGKIYAARSPFLNNSILSVIDNPNNPGTSCNYIDAVIDFGNNWVSYGFPNFIDSYDYSNTSEYCYTEIEEKGINELIDIFPNPTTGPITINNEETQVRQSQLRMMNVAVYDIYGKEVLKQEVRIQKYVIDLSTQPNGIYIVKVTTSKGVAVEKVVKN